MNLKKKVLALALALTFITPMTVIPAAAADGKAILDEADFYLTFEDGVKDDKGKYEFKAEGDVPSVDGKFGKAIATDSENYFVYSDDVEFGTDSWTLTSWVKIDEHSGDQVLFGNKDWNSGGNPGWLITPRDGDWKINGNPGSRFDFQYSYKDSVLQSEKGEWHHIAIVTDRENGTLTFYVNGVVVLEPFSISEYGDGDLDGLSFTMGQDGTGYYADGSLKANFDEVALFRRPLTAEEVAAVYTYAPDGYEAATLVTKETAAGGQSDNPAPAVGEFNGIVTDGLQVYYDGANNTGEGQVKDSAVWRDVSGNGYDFSVSLDGNNHWTDKSYYIDSTPNYFPDKVKDIANGEQYTIELALGEIEQPGTNWVSLIISDNDEFSLFVRVENDNLEYKYNDNNRDRPVAEDGAELVNNSTVAVTFDIVDQDCFLYVDGELLYEAVPTEVNHANYMHLGSEDAKRNWLGDVYAIRFYDRELTAEEIAQNAAADNERYRSGNPIVNPVVETPVAEEPVVETPVAETPAEPVEEPVSAGFASAADAANGKNVITGYEFVSGTEGFGGEGSDNLWDGDTAIKFCTNQFPAESIVKLDGEYNITGFTMATANDNADYNGRSPNAWTISVSADGENWTELAKGDDTFFEETNFTYYAGEGAAEGVSYVKFNAEGTASGTFQVSELTLFGDQAATADAALDQKAEAPNTFDFGIVAAVAAVVSLGGFAVTKKKH
jgi:hypothetical protein